VLASKSAARLPWPEMETWLGWIFSFVAAVIGGLIAAWAALRAQKQAAKDQRQRDLESERRAVNGTLQAIAAELRVLKTRNFEVLARTLENRANTPVKAPLAVTYTEPNRVTVFESNAGILGKIEDAELRAKIIFVYELIRGLIDSLNANSREFERWRSLPGSSFTKLEAAEMLLGLEAGIRNGLANLQRESDELLRMIDKYLEV
jgi:type II secretory pathway pseudopilin PulG